MESFILDSARYSFRQIKRGDLLWFRKFVQILVQKPLDNTEEDLIGRMILNSEKVFKNNGLGIWIIEDENLNPIGFMGLFYEQKQSEPKLIVGVENQSFSEFPSGEHSFKRNLNQLLFCFEFQSVLMDGTVPVFPMLRNSTAKKIEVPKAQNKAEKLTIFMN